MPTNQDLADRLARIAKLQELLGFDKFRAISNERAARTVEGFPEDVIALSKDRAALLKIDGIGPKIADKIIEFATTGDIKELAELTAQVPPGLMPLLEISGLGPKTTRMLWQEGGVTDRESLKKIIDNGAILNLPRMGEKAAEKLKTALAQHEEGSKRLPLGLAAPVAEAFVEQLRTHKGVRQIAYAGSLRRGKDTIGDIDILVATSDPLAVGEAFRTMPQVKHVLFAGETRSSVRAWIKRKTSVAEETGPSAAEDTAGTVQVDLKVVPLESWGAALMYFTGSKEHNVRLRERSLRMGLTLNEYGLFPDDDEKEPPHKRGIKALVSATEEEIYARLGYRWIPPELREDRGELDIFALRSAPGPEAREKASPAKTTKKKATTKSATKSKSGKADTGDAAAALGEELPAPPRLIEISDIKAELHSHTTASDGVLSIVDLANHAKRQGFHTIAVTDHSKSSAIANGLSVERLLKHIDAIRQANELVSGITIFAGSEVDILADGRLDYDDEILAKLDVVVASPHASLSQEPKVATARLLKAVRNPLVHILGHPTGRLINRRPGLAPDLSEIYGAAKEKNVALEINAHWMRLDLRDAHVKGAIDAGCLIAIDCDVHEPKDFDNLRYGITTARRGWLTPDRCVNAWGVADLHKWVKSKR